MAAAVVLVYACAIVCVCVCHGKIVGCYVAGVRICCTLVHVLTQNSAPFIAVHTLAREAPVGIQTRCLRLQLQPPHSQLNLLILQSDKWKLPAQLL